MFKKLRYTLALLLLGGLSMQAYAQQQKPEYRKYPATKFEQLDELLPTPNVYRAADGSPGHQYWQQRADYKIQVSLNDETQTLKGSETITYYNHSPNAISYLWVQLDQNRFHKESNTYKSMTFEMDDNPSYQAMMWWAGVNSEHGYKISNVRDANGKPLPYTIVGTMMRIDLPQPIAPKGGTFTFSLDWEHKIIDANKMGGRGGYEYFPEDGNYLYEIAQWFPRMCVYDDVNGWQNKQFLGRGEFALPFGNYEVAITVPADHIVAATGELQNAKEVLSKTQLKRLEEAKKSDKPVLIVTEEEARENEKSRAKNTKTWVFKAENVRDFAWASSRKFIWDAMQVDVNGRKVWAMSFYPKEGNPLWGEKSTNVVALTLKTYSRYTFDYPYPVTISVHGPVFGMEYPMICFNGGRPNPDGSVPDRTKYAMISVIIHEVGHNFFPMIVNSDERQWTWMDEGFNSFLQYLTEQEVPKQAWAKDVVSPYPSRRGPAKNIVPYMKSAPDQMVPIMTNSEQILQFGNNAYGKPATALNILRETILGHELFDYAFKTYAQRWKFKHPQPADFFRTMEDASGVDLDWFWRGWFYSTEPCDIAIASVVHYTAQKDSDKSPFETKVFPKEKYQQMMERIEATSGIRFTEAEKRIYKDENLHFYSVKFKNEGGLIMPVIVELKFADGTSRIERLPAEIWRYNDQEISKVFVSDKPVVAIVLDPNEETADIDTTDNVFPREEKAEGSKFDEFKQGK